MPMIGTRSWWGWGTLEDAATTEEASALVKRVAVLLPDHDFADHEPPDVAALGVPPPRVKPPTSLADLCSTDAEDRAGHARGKAFRDVVRNLHGDLEHIPDLVARPRTE